SRRLLLRGRRSAEQQATRLSRILFVVLRPSRQVEVQPPPDVKEREIAENRHRGGDRKAAEQQRGSLLGDLFFDPGPRRKADRQELQQLLAELDEGVVERRKRDGVVQPRGDERRRKIRPQQRRRPEHQHRL